MRVPPLGNPALKTFTFLFKYQLYTDNKRTQKSLKIGSYPSMKSDEARRVAKKYSDMLQKGIDPKQFLEEQALAAKQKEEAIKEQQKIGTLKQLVDAFLADMQKNKASALAQEF